MDFIRYNLILFIATFLIWIMFLGVLFLWLVNNKKNKKKILVFIIISVTLSVFVSQTVKMLLAYPRPFEIYNVPPITLRTPQDNSFPSTHTATAFALAFSTYLHFRKYSILFFFSASLVGLGRILSNVHFLGDVAGGVLVGYLAHKITKSILKKLNNLDN